MKAPNLDNPSLVLEHFRVQNHISSMKYSFKQSLGLFALLPLFYSLSCAVLEDASTKEAGFTTLFDGKSLAGWVLLNPQGSGYGVTNGVIYCAKGGGGNLMSEQKYSDFVLRFEFKLEAGSNNGLAIRSPLEGGSLAYSGTELQILDNDDPKYSKLRPAQFHGSVYDVVPAARVGLKKVGKWNIQEVTVNGRNIKVVLNGKTIIDTDLNLITDPNILLKHPGLLRDSGHIGFLGHNDYVEFRNIRLKEIRSAALLNDSPAGFKPLFNGRDLSGWKGLPAAPNDNPTNRAKLTAEQLAIAQAKADVRMNAHWSVKNNALEFDGKGDSLVTARDYRNFELLVDWKILPKGDSGIYLRGTPQVQIWDPRSGDTNTVVGSGGLYNNKIHSSKPLKAADHIVGDWNRFRILMVGDRVHIFLNGELVVNNTPLENYWDRSKPVFASGGIELQNHGNTLWFRNVHIRELP